MAFQFSPMPSRVWAHAFLLPDWTNTLDLSGPTICADAGVTVVSNARPLRTSRWYSAQLLTEQTPVIKQISVKAR